MKPFTIEELVARSAIRPPGYEAMVRERMKPTKDGRWFLDDEDHRVIRDWVKRATLSSCCGRGAKALLKGAAGLVRAALGSGTVSKHVARRRREACAACPHAILGGTICGICKCVIKAKTSLAAEACPDDPPRWTAED